MILEKISTYKNGHFLITESGRPFFWLADTAWELFHRLDGSQAEFYLEIRRKQGFNVIQTVILAEQDGLHTPNCYGHLPLYDDDPTRPNELYFQYIDEIIHLAAKKDLYIGLLPTWGDKVNGQSWWGIGPVIFNKENARLYGKFLGQRYKNDNNILWILGGDHPAEGFEDIWTEMAVGIGEGLGYRPFFTFHPRGGLSSSISFHESEWLDMNMWQSGHVIYDTPNWLMVHSDYQRKPAKPVIDAEPNYEDHPVDGFFRNWQPEMGRYTDYDVRKQAYRAVFSGACGHTYGHQSVWQFWTKEHKPIGYPLFSWDEALFRPGATQMIHLKKLLLSRPYFNRTPAQGIILDLPSVEKQRIYKDLLYPSSAFGLSQDKFYDYFDPARASYPVATCSKNPFIYTMIYFPMPEQSLQIDLSFFPEKVKASWFDPRSGEFDFFGEFSNKPSTFTSPNSGPDWVLVLDQKYEDL